MTGLSHAPRIILVITLMAALSVLAVLFGRSRWDVVSAQSILETALHKRGTAQLTADQVSYETSTLFIRRNPKPVDPPDPFHQSVLGRYSDMMYVERWQRGGDIAQSRIRHRDAKTQVVLFEVIHNGGRTLVYSDKTAITIQHDASAQPGPPQAADRVETRVDASALQALRATPLARSEWGQPAWVLTARWQPTQAELNELKALGDDPFAIQPYIKDLDVNAFNHTWVVDQATQLPVSFEWSAETPSGLVVLQRAVNAPQRILPVQALPPDWLELSVKGVPVVQANQGPVSVPDVSASPSLSDAVKHADFTVFVPGHTDAWAKAGLTLTHLVFKPEARSGAGSSMPFAIQDAASRGLGLELVYLPQPPDGRALAVVQGKADQLIPLMRTRPAVWAKSQPLRLKLTSGDIVDAWLLTGGNLAGPYPQLAVVFEHQGTLVFSVAQNYPTDQALELIASLQEAQ